MSNAPSTHLAQAAGASRRFGPLLAVDDVHLTVGPGEVVGLLGANGAGKTTLIRMILGLLEPSAGEVRLFGQPPRREVRSRIGYMPQSLGLYDDLTVDENLAFRARMFGRAVPRQLDPDLEVVRSRPVGEISLGLRRRAAFAAALLHEPSLLVLDEPTSGVDPLARAGLWDTIRAAAEAGTGVLVTTHHMIEADQCDRLVMMSDGRVAAAGTVSDIVGDRRAVLVAASAWQEAFEALNQAGLALVLVGRTIRVPQADLERVRGVLSARGIEAELTVVPATFEEAFVVLAAGGSG